MDASDNAPPSDVTPRAPRKNIFLSAAIESGEMHGPVRVRNMSETGAMIEGAFLPSVGGRLTLRRQELRIEATVVWVVGGRCGIRFDGIAYVDDWIAGKQTPRPPGPQGQARVDAVQAAVRAGSAPPSSAVGISTPLAQAGILGRIASEMAALERALEAVTDQLSDDPLVLARHLHTVQTLQGAIEVLGHLARILAADDRIAAADRVVLQALRARLLGKPLF